MMRTWEWLTRVKDILKSIGFNNIQSTILTLLLSGNEDLTNLERLVEKVKSEHD